MSDVKVSVIIPVYNAAKFLEKNLLILSKQTLKEIEFICVNDCSTDNSMDILKAFKEVFPDKFVVIDSDKNRGPGGARNIGLSNARGEYIGFMDNDDYVHPDMYKAMYEEAVKGDCDIVKCGYYNKEDNGISVLENITGELDDDKRLRFIMDGTVIWNKIYKRALIDQMSMHFMENVLSDDTDFNIEAVLRAKRVSTLKNGYYYYNFMGKSASRTDIVDMEYEYSNAAGFFDSIESRSKTTPNYEVGLRIKAYIVLTHMKRLLYYLFLKPVFTLKDIEKFDEFTKRYLPDYYNIKVNNAKDIVNEAFNQMAKDPRESYKNLIMFREKIESGELDKEMANKL